MRGERISIPGGIVGGSGSSPHARGTPEHGQHACQDERFIPACAGNAWWRMTTAVWPSVHPRMRGERLAQLLINHTNDGSSPHARGTHPPGQGREAARRFIPACAGNADPGPSGMDQPPVHPRMRGERQGEIGGFPFVAGSSPHARGTPDRIRARPGGLRFIPACAGNAPGSRPAPDPLTVHPRMRGERAKLQMDGVATLGSSPHARGTPGTALGYDSRFAVHPRMRGERPPIDPDRHRDIGSSPHARGTPCSSSSATIPTTVHPRMRGERTGSVPRFRTATGSSPHARGTPIRMPVASTDVRFIPACAGNACRHTSWQPSATVHPRMRGERMLTGMIS